MSIADLYCKGARVWVPDREKVWVGGELVRVVEGECVEVQCEGEEGRRVLEARSHDKLPLLCNPEMLVGANNLTTLSYLHEPAVLHNLSVRFLHSNMIYTYCGIVLVALNPYQSLPIYGSETAAAYKGREMGEMDPHVFAVAEEAFRKMTRDQHNQSLIISGESGAGKTVSAKFAMRYFATVGGASTETQIEKKVLASNPIMEAIGNAKTTRNDNSSRFGKYIEIRFDQKKRITGAQMRTYLLERSRVVTQATEERNYHVFYQLCAARDDPSMAEYHLGPPESFHYTSQGGCIAIRDVCDQSEFAATRQALQLLGFHDNQLGGISRVLSSILHLGNVEIGSRDKGGEVMSVIGESDSHLVTSATLLGIGPAHLAHWLTHRKISTARDVYNKPLTPTQSATARDSLAKHLYSSLFDWIVSAINTSLTSTGPHSSTPHTSSSSTSTSFIGVLDIYGFEVFDMNTFEQFCINYANEKLQQQFNVHVFQLEQAEYVREEIEWSFIDYYDNQPCINLIENRLGVFDLLDETCKMPGGCDALFIQKLYDNHSKPTSTHFTKPRMSRSAFQVSHYAGSVRYESAGFVEKNAEQVAVEYLQLLRGSTVAFLSALFKPTPSHTTPTKPVKQGRRGAGLVSKATVGSQFRSSLRGLMTTLNSTTPHYIRCIKPNDRKLPFILEPQRAVQQLRACGVLETVRLSAAGYPSRWTYNEFFQRYRLLLRSGQVRRDDIRQMCEYILHKWIQDSCQYRFGKTKLFFRAGQVAYLERLRSQRLQEASVCVQRRVRGWLQRKRYRAFRAATVAVQARARGLLARRLVLCLRRTRAAVCIQRHTRGLVARGCYQKLRRAVVATQAVFRGQQARKLYITLLCNQRAVVLQRCVRGWLARRRYLKDMKSVVLAQCCVRRWRARRELRGLRLEARSVNHLQGLNRGLERKVIELQLKLLEGDRVRRGTEEEWNRQKCRYEKALAKAASENERLQTELSQLRESASSAREPQAAGLHSVPENGSMEQRPQAKRNVERGREHESMERELERLRGALSEREAEVCLLRERATTLQREFDSEEPTPHLFSTRPPPPPPPPPASDDQAPPPLPPPPPEKSTFSESILSPLSSKSQSSSLGEILSIILLPPIPLQLINGPCSSTPDIGINPDVQQSGMGTDTKASLDSVPQNETRSLMSGQGGMELGQGASKSGWSDLISGPESLELGQSSMESGQCFTEECLKQLVDQLERERENLLLGNRKMSQELNKIDASKMTSASTLHKIAQENSLLRREMAVVREKGDRAERRRESACCEMQSLVSQVASLKKSLQQTSNAAVLNTSLQHEVARLTEENVSLLETVEGLQKDRSGYRTPMSPRRRTTPCGADSPMRKTTPSARRHVSFSITYKPDGSGQEISGWAPTDQSKLIRDLILDLKPEQVSGQNPCLPAHMIYLSLCRCRHVTGSCSEALGFLDEAVSAVQQVLQSSSTQFSSLSFWLANACHLLNTLQQQTCQTGPKTTLGLQTSLQTSQTGFVTSDLSAYTDKLERLAQSAYQDLFQLICYRIQPLIVPGVLEYESIPNISSVRPILGCHTSSHDPNITITTVTRELSAILEVLRKHCLSPETIADLMRQTFFMINGFLLNNLLLRRDMCHWSKGLQIRYNLSQLEDWARRRGLTGYEVLAQLLPSVQAAKLLQMKKSSSKDAEAICDLCTHLNPLQVQKILTMYSPANEFEERVPAAVIRSIVQKNGADTADPLHLMVDVDHFFPVSFPPSPPTSDYKTLALSLPPSLHHLKYLLTV